MGKAIQEHPLEVRLGESFQLGMLIREVDLGEPTSFLDHVFFWSALNENAKRAKILLTITEPCLNPKISAGAKEKYFVPGNPTQTSHRGPTIWKVMPRNVCKDIVRL